MDRTPLLSWLATGAPLAAAVLIGLVVLVPPVRPRRVRVGLAREAGLLDALEGGGGGRAGVRRVAARDWRL